MTSPPGFIIDDDAIFEDDEEIEGGGLTEVHDIHTVEEAVELLRSLKGDLEALETEIRFVENWIDNAVKDSAIVRVGDKQYKTTPVRGFTTKVDVERMKRLVPEVAARVIKTETVEKVDNDLLAKEIEKGTLKIGLAEQFIEQKPKKTSIRITEHTPSTEEDD